jgi:hypothetical protein
MYKKDDWLGNRIHRCAKCEKMMGNDPDTIKNHNEKFCVKTRKTVTKNAKETDKPSTDQKES